MTKHMQGIGLLPKQVERPWRASIKQEQPQLMTRREATPDNKDHSADSVGVQVVAVPEARVSPARLSDIRRDFVSAIAAIDADIAAAIDAGTAKAPHLRQLRARRDLLLMTGLSTAGVDLPDCAQPSSLAADGPLTAGLDFEREPAFPGHAHGLDLTAALDPRTRAVAGVPGAHLPPAQLARRNPGEETGPRSYAQQQAPRSISTVVYGDFSNAHCYLASILADRLVGTAAAVEWRAVQHHSRLSFGGLHLDEATQQCLAAEWREARPLLSDDLDVGYRFRTFVPNTQAAVAGFAEAENAGVGDEVRRLLFNAYWVDGANIGEPEVLRRLLAAPLRRGTSTAQPVAQSGYAVTVAHGPVTSGAYRLIQAWDEGWRAPGVRDGSELVVLDKAGQVFTGPKALLELARAGRTEPARNASRLATATRLSQTAQLRPSPARTPT